MSSSCRFTILNKEKTKMMPPSSMRAIVLSTAEISSSPSTSPCASEASVASSSVNSGPSAPRLGFKETVNPAQASKAQASFLCKTCSTAPLAFSLHFSAASAERERSARNATAAPLAIGAVLERRR